MHVYMREQIKLINMQCMFIMHSMWMNRHNINVTMLIMLTISTPPTFEATALLAHCINLHIVSLLLHKLDCCQYFAHQSEFSHMFFSEHVLHMLENNEHSKDQVNQQ